jgi:hypothetical protein
MWTQHDSSIYTRIVDIHGVRHWRTGRSISYTVAYRIDGRPDHLGSKGYRVDIRTSLDPWTAIDGGKRVATLAAAKRLVGAYTRAIKAQNTLSPDMSRTPTPSVVSRRGLCRAA